MPCISNPNKGAITNAVKSNAKAPIANICAILAPNTAVTPRAPAIAATAATIAPPAAKPKPAPNVFC